jgi:seryl-tRNA synthetase
MIDIKLVRDNPKIIKDSLKKRKSDIDISKLIKLDEDWRKLKFKEDQLRKQRNTISLKINELKKKGKSAKKELLEAKRIPKEIEKLQVKRRKLALEIKRLLLSLPNLLDKEVPIGKNESQNKEIRKVGKITKGGKSHEELLKGLLGNASKVSGSGFYFFKGELAQLQRALINFMLDFHQSKGRIEIVSPILARPEAAEGTAHLPKFDKDMYKTREGLYLIPTAEMTLTNIHREEVLKRLPKRYYGYTPCFRTEAGQHGSDTPGIFRIHQFDKVEMVTICNPKDSDKEFKSMVSDAEELLKKLEIPYRVIVLCSGDMGFKESLTYDLETWSPYLKKYMETASISKCGDFQARRMNTKYQSKEGLKFVHTLNGSGLAIPRLIISLVECNQNKDGSINIPKVLQSYMNGKKKIR